MSKKDMNKIHEITFGKFDEEEQGYEEEIYNEERKTEGKRTGKKSGADKKTKEGKSKKQPLTEKLKNTFFREKEREIPESWTGQTSVLDIISPSSVDNGSRDYIVVDGVYHSYLYIAGYGYKTRNEAAWLSSLVEAGDSKSVKTDRKI